jgi:hypothetical protein
MALGQKQDYREKDSSPYEQEKGNEEGAIMVVFSGEENETFHESGEEGSSGVVPCEAVNGFVNGLVNALVDMCLLGDLTSPSTHVDES